MNYQTKHDFVKIKSDLAHQVAFSFAEKEDFNGITITSILSTVCAHFPHLKWTASEISDYLLNGGHFSVDNDGKFWQTKKLLEKSKGRFFGISWTTNNGYVKTMNARYHSDNGHYTRITNRLGDQVRNFNPSGLNTLKLDGKTFKGKLAA